ncbi:uncharacterized protein LOC135293077 [Passer domesticus]|uniref:uncharacterized protein LOC135293077 n=1 Tax=Passer domesticus TaxID=48849 RepID=UPI0030FF1278
MGQCVSKTGIPFKGKKKIKSIPLDSPLGQLLDHWDSQEATKTLDQVRMIYYCTEIWPKLKLQGRWPWYGTHDPWMCSQLNQFLRTQENPDIEQLTYAACWQGGVVSEGSVKICKLKKKEEDKEESEGEQRVTKTWDPLDHLPPPPPIYPVLNPNSIPAPPTVIPLPPPPNAPMQDPLPVPPTVIPLPLPPNASGPDPNPVPTLPAANLVPPTLYPSSSTAPLTSPPSNIPNPRLEPSSSPMVTLSSSPSHDTCMPPSVHPPLLSPNIAPDVNTMNLPPSPSPISIPLPPANWKLSSSPLSSNEQDSVSQVTTQTDYSIEGPWCNTRSKTSKPEKMMPLREVPMGGMIGGVGFVNAPLTASEVRGFKKELGNLVEDPVGISNQVDQFLGPNIYTWGELNSILNILFCPEEVRMIRAAGIRIWEKENRVGPPGDLKMPLVDPGWDPNREEGRRNMRDYRSLIIKGIKESVPRSSNTKLAFEGTQEKDETPASWLTRLRRNFQLYSNIDPDSPEGQVLLKVQFVTKSWPDIRRKLEKIEDWQDKCINDLLKEALKVYLRREEEKARAKAKIMVAVARESIGADSNSPVRSPGIDQNKPPPSVGRYWEKPGFRKDGERSRKIEGVPSDRTCYYCGEVGHFRRYCKKLRLDEAIVQEQEALERVLRGDD